MIDSALLGLAGGTIGGTLAGGTISWFFRRPRRPYVIDGTGTVDIDPVLNEQIKRAAAQWAEMYGQPDAAPLIANKLRLGCRVARQRLRRWSR